MDGDGGLDGWIEVYEHLKTGVGLVVRIQDRGAATILWIFAWSTGPGFGFAISSPDILRKPEGFRLRS